MSTNPYDPPPEVKVPPVGPGMETSPDARQMAMLAHLLGALLNFIGPLIIFLTQKEKHPFIEDQSKEALNFQLTILIIHLVCFAGAIITCGLLFFLPFVPYVLQLVFGIIACIKANNGELYRYPFNIRFIK
jgi:uncharacterized Tic20 family protein